MLQERFSKWRGDILLRRVIRNSSYLFSSNAVSSVLGAVQMYFVVRLLNPEEYGLALGIIMVFVSNVNRLLSFRMSEVVVKYVGEALAQDNKDRAAALVKGIGITEAITSVVAYLVLLALLVYETSVGVLQATNHFNYVARANLFQSITTAILVIIGFILKWGVF